jgi:hypothetical protein
MVVGRQTCGFCSRQEETEREKKRKKRRKDQAAESMQSQIQGGERSWPVAKRQPCGIASSDWQAGVGAMIDS